MRFAAALSTNADTTAAIAEVCRAALAQLNSSNAQHSAARDALAIDLAMVFVSHDHVAQMEQIAAGICDAIGCEALLGCTGESIVGGSREIESSPAISLWLANMPGVSLDLFHLDFRQHSDGALFSGWPSHLEDEWPSDSTVLLLAEPFSFPADVLLEHFNEDRAGMPVIGGMASGGHAPGENRLILGRAVHERGAVTARIGGSVCVRSVVSQGCRPIGRHFVVTKSERNVIMELSGATAMSRLHEVYETLSDGEKALVRNGLHVGRVLSEYQDEFKRGDFLVRNVVGADPKTGVIAIGDYVRPGQTVQFHIRDAESADEDLRMLLRESATTRDATATQSDASATPRDASAASNNVGSSTGALLFTCNGRGTRLFAEANHDAQCVTQTLGKIPLAGFFAQGELGPVGGKNFLHGFTASIALFEERRD